MDALFTSAFPSQELARETLRRGQPSDCQDTINDDLTGQGATAREQAAPMCAESSPFEDDLMEFRADDTNEELLRSFDMIFQLHQRSEEIRRRLENIDRILLSSRTVAGLVETVTESLQRDMELTAVRVLFREDHPLACACEIDAPPNMGTIPQSLLENESLFRGDPYILDCPSGDLGESLFGDAASLVASAVVANLCTDSEELGILCLGSDDPHRYCGGMNTELIGALAEKISLGLANAWDHEIRVRQALMGDVEGVYSEVFLKEYLRKEFQRSWRTYRTFSLMAIAWGLSYAANSRETSDLLSLIKSHLRAADVVAEGETVNAWVLLPDTDLDGAKTAAERILRQVSESAFCGAQIYLGITAFSRDAVTMHKLMRQAKIALAEAIEADQAHVVAQPVAIG
jgi:uncharacterized protein YigA (DUF484 family)